LVQHQQTRKAGKTGRVRRQVGSRSPATQATILHAALAVFSARGFDAAPMQEIAQRADVHIPQLSYHFGSKLNLWKAAVDRAFAELNEEVAVLLSDGEEPDDGEQERRLVRAFVHLIGRNPAFILFMHEEGKRKGPRMRWLVDRHVKPLFDMTTALLERAQRRGLISDEIQPVYFHYILSGAVSFIFHQAEECRRVSGIDPFSESSLEMHARAVELLLLGGPSGRVE
jgi:TetR/AcrR family transcriptional regulator